jgi:hypothetical protein
MTDIVTARVTVLKKKAHNITHPQAEETKPVVFMG